MKTNESDLTFTNLIEHVEKQLIAAQNDLEDIKDQIYKTLKEKNELGQKTLSRQNRGPAMLAFGALTAVTAGAGIACSPESIFVSCGGTDQNREDIDFALTQIEENNQRWIEIKGKMKDKMFIIANQLKDVNNFQRKIIETLKNHSEALNKAVSLIRNNSRKLMACNQLFYARDQILQVQTNLIGSLSALLNEIKSYRTAVFSYKLTILN